LNIRQVSYNWGAFARNAFKIMVDVDEAEFRKPTVKPDLAVHCDLRFFLTEFLSELGASGYQPSHDGWLAWCRERVARYPVVQEKHRHAATLNPYHFIETLFGLLEPDDVVVCGNAAACIVPFQAARLKKGQRLFSNSGAASMGHDLPAAIGAAVARGGKRVICIAGDGSIQLNIQELQTIVHHKLPVKIFVLNNGGYLSIRSTQANFFGEFIGEGPKSGVSLPDIVKVAEAYGVESLRIEDVASLAEIARVLDSPGPALCEVKLDPSQGMEPRLMSRQMPDGSITTPALEDMWPFLGEEELRSNMMPV
jgi:acetolactate synthase-1/2/3 large subunit